MHNSRAILRRVAPGATTVVLAGMTVVAAGGLFPATASAATPSSGQVVVQPAGGNDLTQLTLITSGPCHQGTNVVATVYGNGFGRFGQIVVANTPSTMFATTSSGGMIIPLAGTMRYFANLPQVPAVLSGPYRFVVDCRTATGLVNLQTFTSMRANFTASGPGARTYHVVNPVGVPTVQVASATQTPSGASTPPSGTGSSATSGSGAHSSSGTKQASQGNNGHAAPNASGAAAARAGGAAAGTAGGGAVLTIVVSILGGLLALAAVAIFWLARRRRPSTGSPLRRANLGSSTH